MPLLVATEMSTLSTPIPNLEITRHLVICGIISAVTLAYVVRTASASRATLRIPSGVGSGASRNSPPIFDSTTFAGSRFGKTESVTATIRSAMPVVLFHYARSSVHPSHYAGHAVHRHCRAVRNVLGGIQHAQDHGDSALTRERRHMRGAAAALRHNPSHARQQMTQRRARDSGHQNIARRHARQFALAMDHAGAAG